MGWIRMSSWGYAVGVKSKLAIKVNYTQIASLLYVEGLSGIGYSLSSS